MGGTALEACLVRMRGLEPPLPCENMDLNHARLPIPPHPHCRWASLFSETGASRVNLPRPLPYCPGAPACGSPTGGRYSLIRCRCHQFPDRRNVRKLVNR